MKNKKYLLLLLLFVVSSCTNNLKDSDSGENETSNTSSESGSDFIDVNYEPSQTVNHINAVYEDCEPTTRNTSKANNAFKDASYTFNITPSDNYSDPEHNKLVNGITTEAFDTENWVGFYTNQNVTIDLTLPKSSAPISNISFHMLQVESYAIYYPTYVSLEISYNQETYIPLGTIYTPTDLKSSSNYTYQFGFPYVLSARYFRFSMNKDYTNKGFLFVDEITAYEYNENGQIDLSGGNEYEYDFYNYNLNTKTTTVSNSSTDDDYNLYQNLALLDGVSINAKTYRGLEKDELNSNSKSSKFYKLNDGIVATNTSNLGDENVKFYKGGGRNIDIDLGNIMAVDKFKCYFLHNSIRLIGVPTAYSISLSIDGINFTTVAGNNTNLLLNKTNQIYVVDESFDSLYKARYIRLSFVLGGNLDIYTTVAISEIEVYGLKNLTNSIEVKEDDSIVNGYYPDPQKCGIENVLFVPIRDKSTGYYFTKENAIPYLSYVDQENNPKDRFIDCICISANSVTLSSNDPCDNVVLIGNQLFKDDINLDAIDQAMASINEALKTSYKEQIIISLYVPSFTGTCKDCDKDGKAEILTDSDDIADYMIYQVNYFKNLFDSKNYQNIELKGFYWNEEYFDETKTNYTIPGMKKMNDYIHSLNKISFWCPFFGVDTICYWKDAGFDFACLQPNYMFNNVDSSRIDETALIALVNGMCVEIEIEDITSDISNSKYKEYLFGGIKYGYMNSIKVYYQGTMPGAFYHSASSNYELYTNTYKYAKKQLDSSILDKQTANLDLYNSKTVEITHDSTLNESIGDTSNLNLNIIQSPTYGSIRLNLDGTFTYNAMYNYQGYDYCIINISDNLGNSKEIKITIKITK